MKLDEEAGLNGHVFEHPHFQRQFPELLHLVTSSHKKQKKKKKTEVGCGSQNDRCNAELEEENSELRYDLETAQAHPIILRRQHGRTIRCRRWLVNRGFCCRRSVVVFIV
jgi:hypothetical protein